MGKLKINSKLVVLIFILINILLIFDTYAVVNNLLGCVCILGEFFLPGLLMLNLFNLQFDRSFTELVLLSLGFSVFFITSICLLDCIILPTVGIDPIQKPTLSLSIFIASVIISVIFIRKINSIDINYNIHLIKNNFKFIIFMLIIFTLNIFGSLILVKTNVIIILSFILIAVTPILSVKYASDDIYPFILWVCALSLVLYNSLFGMYIRPTDNIYEILIMKDYILKYRIWNTGVPANIIAMPNVVLLIPFLSFFTGGIIQTYKYIVPFLASFIPVIIYESSKLKYNSKVAFYSSLFYIFMFSYFTWNSITMKMVTAAIYLSLISILIFKDGSDVSIKLALVIFTLSLIFSHYGTAAIFGLALVLVYISSNMLRLCKYEVRRYLNFRNYIFLYLVVYYGYSMYVADGSIFDSVITTISNTVTSTFKILSPKSYGSEIVISSVPIYLQILKYIYILSYFLIIVGLSYEVLKRLKNKYVDIFYLISMSFTIFLVIPYLFPCQYGSGRIWFITLIFLSPFLIVGFEYIHKLLQLRQNVELFILVFIIIFFIFNSGLASECIWKHNIGASVYISYPRITKSGTLWEREYLNRVYLYVEDIYSASWLRFHIDKNIKIYVGKDSIHNLEFFGFSRGDIQKKIGNLPILIIINKNKKIYRNRYIYISKFNSKTRMIKTGGTLKPRFVSISKIVNLNRVDKIYSNGYSKIYLTK